MFPKLLLRVGGALLFGKYRVDLFHRKLKLRLRSGGGANVQRRQGCRTSTCDSERANARRRRINEKFIGFGNRRPLQRPPVAPPSIHADPGPDMVLPAHRPERAARAQPPLLSEGSLCRGGAGDRAGPSGETGVGPAGGAHGPPPPRHRHAPGKSLHGGLSATPWPPTAPRDLAGGRQPPPRAALLRGREPVQHQHRHADHYHQPPGLRGGEPSGAANEEQQAPSPVDGFDGATDDGAAVRVLRRGSDEWWCRGGGGWRWRWRAASRASSAATEREKWEPNERKQRVRWHW